MGVKIITPPTLTTVVLTADLRTHLKLASDGSQDELATTYLAAAHKFAEHYAGRPIGSQTRQLALDAFPDDAIELGPVVTAISSVTYVDTSGVTQTVSNTNYTLDDYSFKSWVLPAYQFAWPDTREVANAVKVQYVCGDTPDAVKSALLLLTGHLYEENRSGEKADLPTAALRLLDTVKVWAL